MNTPDLIEPPADVTPTETPLNPQSEKRKAIFVEMFTESSALKTVVSGALTDVVADWVVSEYTTAAREFLNTKPDKGERWKMLRQIGNDVATYRRGDHRAGWLGLQQAKFDETVRQAAEEKQRRNNPKPGGLTRETLEKIERELKLF